MHWGLTTFEKKRIEKIALDHPYFDTHAPLLTKREIASIVKEGSHKNGYQVIAEVMAELGITYVPAKHKKRSFREALRDMSFVPSFRRSVALGLLCLLLVLFMTFTAPGRAFAEEVYSFIVEFVDGALRSYHQSNSQPDNDSFPSTFSLPENLHSPQELAVLLNDPVYCSDDSLVSFYYRSSGSGITIKTKYINNSGDNYMVFQRIHLTSDSYSTYTEIDSSFNSFETANGTTMYAGIASDGVKTIIWYPSRSVVSITSESILLQDLQTIAASIHEVP